MRSTRRVADGAINWNNRCALATSRTTPMLLRFRHAGELTQG